MDQLDERPDQRELQHPCHNFSMKGVGGRCCKLHVYESVDIISAQESKEVNSQEPCQRLEAFSG